MALPTPQSRYVPIIAAMAGAYAMMACHEEVSLGAWISPAESAATTGAGATGTISTAGVTSSGTGGSAGAPSTDGSAAPPGLPGCLAAGEPGPFNLPGTSLGATETATEWTWPGLHSSLEFDLMVEREILKDPTATAATRGYYWAHQFYFDKGATGWFGIQAEGVYQIDAPDPAATREVTKMAVFWLSGPPLEAELGDIDYPDARIADIAASGVNYTTIHAKFDWQPCRVYRFRIDQESVDADGNVWYGAWIEDLEAVNETFLGRMLLPEDAGAFTSFSVSKTLPIEFREPDTCMVPQASALYGIPHTVGGGNYAAVGKNAFNQDQLACQSSRFTQFPGAVRHEQGVRQ